MEYVGCGDAYLAILVHAAEPVHQALDRPHDRRE